jgi:hypothetical protein
MVTPLRMTPLRKRAVGWLVFVTSFRTCSSRTANLRPLLSGRMSLRIGADAMDLVAGRGGGQF